MTEDIQAHSPEITKLLIQSFEADYVIVTKEEWPGDQRSNIVENQLKDLDFVRNKHYWIYVVDKGVPIGKDDHVFDIYFAIRFTGAKIDEVAHKFKIKGDLDQGNIKARFNKFCQKEFITFDARQRLSCIMLYLEKEINFEHYTKTGVIKEHYPLHRTTASEMVRGSVNKYYSKLVSNLRTNNANWSKYLEPVHMIKKYYGERFGFYYLYLINY